MKENTVNSNNKDRITFQTTRALRLIMKIVKIREFTILGVLIIICFIISLFSPYFLTVDNLMGIAKSFSTDGIMAIGMTLVIITGGIDLSVGSVLGLSALMTAMAFQNHVNPFLCVLCGLSIGVVFGFVNGLLVTKVNLQPFIATLGTVSIGRGLIYIISKGIPLTPQLPPKFVFLGQGYLWVIPMPVVVMAVLMIIFAVVMTQTRYGRHVYAIGGNELSSKLSGIKTSRVKLSVYVISSLMAAIAGVVLYARLTSAEASAGSGEELQVIAAAAIGGASLAGGSGSIVGAIVGAALIGVISNGIVLLNINTYAQQAITGVVILIAVSLDMLRNKKNI